MATLNIGQGVTATLVRGEEVLVKHFDVDPIVQAAKAIISDSGTAPAVRDLIRFCDVEGWRVRSISTPTTILRDLQGAREHVNATGKHQRSPSPEEKLLGARLDLLEERETRVTTVASTYVDQHRRRRRRGRRSS